MSDYDFKSLFRKELIARQQGNKTKRDSRETSLDSLIAPTYLPDKMRAAIKMN
jgi:hypothetical protein